MPVTKNFFIFLQKIYFVRGIENHLLFLHSLIQTIQGLGECSQVKQTLNFVSSWPERLKNSKHHIALQAMQTQKTFSIAT